MQNENHSETPTGGKVSGVQDQENNAKNRGRFVR